MELLGSVVLNWYYPDPSGDEHIVIPVGKPDVACLTFGLPRRKCLDMVHYGHTVALSRLDTAIADGRVPILSK